jgi:peptidoglycan/LPS O-acetylase OafA/YrhL
MTGRGAALVIAGRDDYFDYLRALAIVLVFGTHYSFRFVPGGSIGVSVFFCLSGYFICSLLYRLPELSLDNVAKFVFRRVMRIYPLYAVQIAVFAGLLWTFHPAEFDRYLSAVPGLLTFSVRPASLGYSTAITWTLHTEFWFYVTFPLIFWWAKPRGLVLPFAVLGIVASWLAKAFIGHGNPDDFLGSFSFRWLLVYGDQLLYGVVCAAIVREMPELTLSFRSRSLAFLSIALIVLSGLLVPLSGEDWPWHPLSSAVAFLTGLLILFHHARPSTPHVAWLSAIGRWSYSIYLLHGLPLDFAPAISAGPFHTLLPYGVVVILAASVTYAWIERPGIKWSHRVAAFGAKYDLA